MTEYILHGGASKRLSNNNKKFFKETAGLKDPAKILIILFSREKNLWEEIYINIQKLFTSATPEKEIKFSLASEDINELINQIEKSDIIYMHGGDSHKLKEVLDRIPDLQKHWENKTVAGSSAGALVLAKYWYENDDDTCNKGLGILPFKLFCHYDKTKKDKLKRLMEFGEPLKTYTLPEENFFSIEE